MSIQLDIQKSKVPVFTNIYKYSDVNKYVQIQLDKQLKQVAVDPQVPSNVYKYSDIQVATKSPKLGSKQSKKDREVPEFPNIYSQSDIKLQTNDNLKQKLNKIGEQRNLPQFSNIYKESDVKKQEKNSKQEDRKLNQEREIPPPNILNQSYSQLRQPEYQIQNNQNGPEIQAPAKRVSKLWNCAFYSLIAISVILGLVGIVSTIIANVTCVFQALASPTYQYRKQGECCSIINCQQASSYSAYTSTGKGFILTENSICYLCWTELYADSLVSGIGGAFLGLGIILLVIAMILKKYRN